MLLNELFNKGLICGFREPALFIQKGQHARRVSLITEARRIDTFCTSRLRMFSTGFGSLTSKTIRAS